jgi:hypothetical protein
MSHLDTVPRSLPHLQPLGSISLLPVSLSAPVKAGLIYTLTYPSLDRDAQPFRLEQEGGEPPAWMNEVRALVAQATKEGAHFTHIVATRSATNAALHSEWMRCFCEWH